MTYSAREIEKGPSLVKLFHPISLGRKRSWRAAAIATAAVAAVLIMGMATPSRADARELDDSKQSSVKTDTMPTQSVACDVISADYHRPLANGDHINVTLNPPGGQVNIYVDQNIAGGASYNGQNNLGLKVTLFGVEQKGKEIPLKLIEIESGILKFDYGEMVKNLGINSWKVTFVQAYNNDTPGDWPGLECDGTPPPSKDATASVEVTQQATCTSPSKVEYVGSNVTWSPAEPDLTVGTHTPVATATEGHLFTNGDDTKSVPYTIEDRKPSQSTDPSADCYIAPPPPTVPEPKVTYTQWVDGSFECGDTSVTQTRTEITTPFKLVFQEGQPVIVEDTAGITTVTETQTRELTKGEIDECEIVPVPAVVPEMFFHDSCDITDDGWSATGEPSDEENVFISDDGILRVTDVTVDEARTVEGVFTPRTGTYVPTPGKNDTYAVEDGNAVWRYTFSNELCETTPPTTPPTTAPTTPPVVNPEDPQQPEQPNKAAQSPVTSQVTSNTLASTGNQLPGVIIGGAFLLVAVGIAFLKRARRQRPTQ